MSKKIKSDKVKYPYGVNCCIWTPIDDNDEDIGLCFDFKEEMIDDIIQELQELKNKEAIEYEPDVEYEKNKIKQEEKESKWYYKFWERWLENCIIQITPFDWQFRFEKRPLFFSVMAKSSGISIGPVKIMLPSLKVKK
jgi:hypothetical protein